MKEQRKFFQTVLTGEWSFNKELLGDYRSATYRPRDQTENWKTDAGTGRVNRLVFGRENNLTIQKDQV